MNPAPKTGLIILLLALGGCDYARSDGAQCGVPLKKWEALYETPGLVTIWNLVRLNKTGELTWNGQPVTHETLANYLKQASAMKPGPGIVLAIQPGAPCANVRRVRGILHAAPICSFSGGCSEDLDWDNPAQRQIS